MTQEESSTFIGVGNKKRRRYPFRYRFQKLKRDFESQWRKLLLDYFVVVRQAPREKTRVKVASLVSCVSFEETQALLLVIISDNCCTNKYPAEQSSRISACFNFSGL